MDAESLADDVFLMSFIYKSPADFELAMENVIKALNQLVEDKVSISQLVNNYSGWRSYHFQSIQIQKHKSDLRIIFQSFPGFVRVRGFGNRWIPTDIYERLQPRD